MADNFEADAGSGGVVFAGDDISGVVYPRGKIILGADGVNDGDVCAGNPLPISGAITVTSGAITASLSATDNAVLDAMVVDLAAIEVLSTAANVDLAAIEVLLGTIDADTSNITACDTGAVVVASGTVTANLSATDNAVLDAMVVDLAAIEVLLGTIDADTSNITACDTGAVVVASGTITSITNAVAVTGAFYQTTQPISVATIPSHAVTNVGTFATQATLQAGTAAFGKLAANSGVDIGDVDVLTLPDSIDGPGAPTIDSYTTASISTSAATANQVLVAAPGASKQIWVYGFIGTADTGDGSISIQDSDDTAITGVMPVAENGGFAFSPSGNFAMPLWKVATNKALEMDTLTCGFKGSLTYAIASV